MKQLLVIIVLLTGQSILAAEKQIVIEDPILRGSILYGIESLVLPGNITENGLKELIKLNRLKTLSLYHCKQIKNFNALSDLSQLENLNLHGTRISNLREISGLSNLKTLVLNNCVGLRGPDSVKGIERLQKLSSVNFKECFYVEDSCLKEIAKIKGLKALGLYRTKITDEGLKEIAKLSRLESLNLGGTKITNEGLKDLAKLQQLKQLKLSGVKITGKGIRELNKLHNLTHLDLRDTKILKVDVADLQKAMPKCNIRHNAKE